MILGNLTEFGKFTGLVANRPTWKFSTAGNRNNPI